MCLKPAGEVSIPQKFHTETSHSFLCSRPIVATWICQPTTDVLRPIGTEEQPTGSCRHFGCEVRLCGRERSLSPPTGGGISRPGLNAAVGMSSHRRGLVPVGTAFSGLFPLAVSLRCLSVCPLMSVVERLSVLRKYSEHHLQNWTQHTIFHLMKMHYRRKTCLFWLLLLHEPENCASPFSQHSIYLLAKITPKQIFGNVIMEELGY